MRGIYEGKIADVEDKQGRTPSDGSLALNELGDDFQKAAKTYKSLNGFKEEQLKNVLSVSAEWKDFAKKEKENYGRDIDDIDIGLLDEFSSNPNVELNVGLKYEDYKETLGKFNQAIRGSDFLKGTLKAAPYVGAAFTLVDAFVGGGKQGPEPVKLTPMSINMQASYSGTITTAKPYTHFICYLPGTDNGLILREDEYPYYNHSLGVLNLPEKPDLQYTTYNTPVYWPQNASPITHIKVKMPGNDDLSYILNPHAGLKDRPEIMAQLLLTFKTQMNLNTSELIAELL